MQLDLADLKARTERPDELARGLAKEVRIQKGGDDLLLSRERKQYLRAIQDALAGAEAARVVLEGGGEEDGRRLNDQLSSGGRADSRDVTRNQHRGRRLLHRQVRPCAMIPYATAFHGPAPPALWTG